MTILLKWSDHITKTSDADVGGSFPGQSTIESAGFVPSLASRGNRNMAAPGWTSSVVSGLHHAPGTFPRIRQAQATLFRSMTFTYRLPLRATSTTRAAQCARPNSCLSQFSLWMRGPVRASGPDAVWQPIIDFSCKVPKYNTVLQILNPTNINRVLCWQWQSNSKVLNSKYEY